MNRVGETIHAAVRSERLFKQEAYWYYKTRENVNVGPFDSKEDAQNGVQDFIEFILGAEPQAVHTFERCAPQAA